MNLNKNKNKDNSVSLNTINMNQTHRTNKKQNNQQQIPSFFHFLNDHYIDLGNKNSKQIIQKVMVNLNNNFHTINIKQKQNTQNSFKSHHSVKSSFINGGSQNVRSGSNNQTIKQHSFVMNRNSKGLQNYTTDLNQNKLDQIYQSRFQQKIQDDLNQIQKEQSKYKDWTNKVKQLAKLQNKKQLQNVYGFKQQKQQKQQKGKQRENKKKQQLLKLNEQQAIQQKLQHISHHYIMLQINSIQNIFWYQFQRQLQSYKKTHLARDCPMLYYRLIVSLQNCHTNSNNINNNDYHLSVYPKKIITEICPLNFNTKFKQNIKNTSNIKQNNLFSCNDKFAVYFHTENNNVNVVIELILYTVQLHKSQSKQSKQSKQNQKQQIKSQVQIVHKQYAFSVVKIPIKKQINKQNNNKYINKQLQKYSRILFNDIIQQINNNISTKNKNKQQLNPQNDYNNYGILNYFMLDSQYYKVISKLIPSQYLVYHQDVISGLYGSHLPKTDDMTIQIKTSNQTNSLYLQTENIQIKNNYFISQKNKFQSLMRYKKGNLQNLQIKNKQTVLTLILHNGLKQIHKVSQIIKQKMQIQYKIDQVQIQNLQRSHLKTKNSNQMISFKNFQCPMIVFPILFIESQFYLILQIEQIVEVITTQRNLKSNKIQNSNQKYHIPIAYSFMQTDKISSNKLMQKKFYQGHYLKDQLKYQSNKNKQKRLSNFNNYKSRLNTGASYLKIQQSSKLLNTNKNIDNENQQLSRINQQVYSKIKMFCILKQPYFDNTWFGQNKKIQQSLLLRNQLIGIQSGHYLTQQMKIQLEKQKVLKQINKISLQKKYQKKFKIKQQIKIFENVQILYLNINQQQDKNKKIKLILLNQLKNYLEKSQINIDKINNNRIKQQNKIQNINIVQIYKQVKKNEYSFNDKFYNLTYIQSQRNKSNYFKTYEQLFRTTSFKGQNLIQHSHYLYPNVLNKIFYNSSLVLNSDNYLYNNNDNYMNQKSQLHKNNTNTNKNIFSSNQQSLSEYGYQKIPLQILRTQLTQINYNNLILFNPLQLKPLQLANNSLYTIPNKFYIKILFWNMQNTTKIPLKIQPQTGQIVIFKEQQKQTKNIQINNMNNTKQKNKNKQNNYAKINNNNVYKTQQQQNNINKNNKLNLQKILHFEYQSQQKYHNKYQIFIDFISYLYNGLMQIILYDQTQQIGRTFFRLRRLIRKKKYQTDFIQQQTIFSKYGPICTLKMECKSIRKQKNIHINKNQIINNKNNQTKTNRLQKYKQIRTTSRVNQDYKTRSLNQDQDIKLIGINSIIKHNKVNNNLINMNINLDKINMNINIEKINMNMNMDKISQNQQKQQKIMSNQKQRIQKYKRLKQTNLLINQQKQPQIIQRIIQKDYLTSQYNIKVVPFKKTFILIQLQNKSKRNGLFFITINDQDQIYYKNKYNVSELKIIKNIQNQLNQQEKQKIQFSPYNKEKLLKYKTLTQHLQVELEQNQKFVVLCEYLSYRKYMSQQQDNVNNYNTNNNEYININNEQQYSIYNHLHTITLSLLQSCNQSVVISVSKIHIFPQLLHNIISFNQSIIKNNSKLISFPFLLSQIIKNNYQIYLNDSRCFMIEQGIDILMIKSYQNSYNNTNMTNKFYYNNKITNDQEEQLDNQNKHILSNHVSGRTKQSDRQSTGRKKEYQLQFNNQDYVKQINNNYRINQFNNKNNQINNRNNQINNRNNQFNRTKLTSTSNNINKLKNYNFLSLQIKSLKSTTNNKKVLCLNLIPKNINHNNNNNDNNNNNKNNKSSRNQYYNINSNHSNHQYNKQKQQNLINSSRRNYFQPIFIQVILNQIQHEQVNKFLLFQPLKNKLRIYHQWLQINNTLPRIIGIVCEDIQFKTKQFWIQLDTKNNYTQIQYKYTSTLYGIRNFIIKFIDPLKHYNLIKKHKIQLLNNIYLKQILFTIMTPFPPLKGQIIINLSLNSKITYEQPFTFTNPYSQKTIFSLYTSHVWYLCVDEKDHILQIKGKQDKKVKIKINTHKIIQHYKNALQSINNTFINHQQFSNAKIQEYQQIIKNNLLPIVVLGFVSEKSVEYYGFKFKIQ